MSRRIAGVAGKMERQRKLARDAHQRRLERQAQRARRAKQWAVSAIAVVVMAAVGVGIAVIASASSPAGSKAKAATTSPSAAASPSATASPSTAATPSATPSPASTAAIVNGKCVYTASGPAARKVSLPPATPDTAAKYTATIKTNRGDIVIDLLGSRAPCTVKSFVSLANQNYFSNTPCHRLTTTGIFVLQCGDPTGTGTGGPGYEFYTENLAGAKYPAGTVAMARAQSFGSNGSQFFLVYKTTNLPPSYTPFGTIVSGLNVLQNVAKAGTDNSNGAGDGHPKEKVQIESVTISKA
jgi:peptidyl-prolyl cis-trans isomerase B (cyclophilin B)